MVHPLQPLSSALRRMVYSIFVLMSVHNRHPECLINSRCLVWLHSICSVQCLKFLSLLDTHKSLVCILVLFSLVLRQHEYYWFTRCRTKRSPELAPPSFDVIPSYFFRRIHANHQYISIFIKIMALDRTVLVVDIAICLQDFQPNLSHDELCIFIVIFEN